MRQTALGELRNMLKGQLGFSLDVNTGEDMKLNLALNMKQKFFASEYDWPFLQTMLDVAVTGGNRYASLPTLNFERPVQVFVDHNNFWTPLEYGIGPVEYNMYRGNTADPVRKWAFNDQTQFEVWPTPKTAQTVRFIGQRPVVNMDDDTVLADLDDMLLVLFCTADRAMRGKQQDAQLKLAEAQQRLAKIRGSYPSDTVECRFGGLPDEPVKVKYVAIA